MRKKGNTVLAGLIICLLLVFLAAAGKLFGAYLKYQKGDVSYEKLQEYVQEPEEEESPESEKEKEEPKNRYLEIDFAGLKAVNPDVIAWIQIPALDISYPVVQGKDNAYERYFKGDGKVQELCFNDKVYHLCIQNVMAFPQDYAAMMTRMMEIREIPKVVGIDIGGFTSDYLLMRSGRPDMDYCDSLEKGVITMYNDIISSINSEYDMLLEEADIDSIIKGKTQYYEEAVVQAVETMVQNFVTDLLNSIRERGIDTKSTYTVFIGGGAVLLERFLEQADRLGKHTFIRDMKANADGYDLLYRMTQAGV